MMKRKKTIRHIALICLVMLITATMAGCTVSGYSERKELDITALEQLYVSSGSGDVTVYPTDGDPYVEMFVREGGIRLKKAELEVHQSGTSTDISVSGGMIGIGYLDIRLDVYLPEDVVQDFHAKVSSGSFLCRAFTFQTLEGQLSSGDMTFERVKAEKMNFDVSSGNLDISGATADSAEFYLSSGDIEASFEGEVSSLTTSVSSGNMEIEGAFLGIKASTTSGNTDIESAIVPAEISGKVTSGNLDIEVPDTAGGFTVSYEALSGSFHSDFAPGLDEKKGNFIVGSGEGIFDFSLTSGDVYLKRR